MLERTSELSGRSNYLHLTYKNAVKVFRSEALGLTVLELAKNSLATRFSRCMDRTRNLQFALGSKNAGGRMVDRI